MQSLSRIVQIIDLISKRGDGVSLTDLVLNTSISKTALHRITGELCDSRLLMKGRNGLFYMGPLVMEWSERSRKDQMLIRAARPILEDIQSVTHETVHLFMYDGKNAYYLDKIESDHSVRMASQIGTSTPLHSTGGGKAILANLTSEERNDYYRSSGLRGYTAKTLTDPEILDSNLNGYSTSGIYEEIGENEEDIRCFAVPILDSDSYPIGSISVAVPIYRFRQESMPEWRAILVDARIRLEQRLWKGDAADEQVT